MKIMIKNILVLFLTVGMLCSCVSKQEAKTGKKGSSGKTCELMIVIEKEHFQGTTKHLVDSLFASPILTQLRPEPMFSIVTIPPSSFQSQEMFRVHRNIIMVDVKSENPNKVYRHIDNWAAPQVVWDFAVKDLTAFDTLLAKYYPKILDDFYNAEHKRIQNAFMTIPAPDLMDKVEKQYGFRLTFSNEYSVAKMSDTFGWIRKETKDYSIGILIKKVPYTTQKAFESEAILDSIDAMMKQHVPGPADSSYMGLERKRFDIEHRQVKLADQYCIEHRGQWKTFGDFMGGPFVSYTLTSPDNQYLITLVGYVYSPRFDRPTYLHRDFLMQTEGICYSIKFSE